MSVITTTSFRRTYNLGNYESISVGCEMTVECGDTEESIAKKAAETIEKIYIEERKKEEELRKAATEKKAEPQPQPAPQPEAPKVEAPKAEPQPQPTPQPEAPKAEPQPQHQPEAPKAIPLDSAKFDDQGRRIVPANSKLFLAICKRISDLHEQGGKITLEEIDGLYSFESNQNRLRISALIDFEATKLKIQSL